MEEVLVMSEMYLDELMDNLLPWLVFGIIVLVIFAFLVLKDMSIIKKLKENLAKNGYAVGDGIKIPDSKNPGKPFYFLADFVNKKWFLANYHSETAQPYNFFDILSYTVKIRSKGTDYVEGEVIEYFSYNYSNRGIFSSNNITENNCEYIEINLKLSEHVQQLIPATWIMYEHQPENGTGQNTDFTASYMCISSAAELETQLFNIISANKRV